MQFITFTIDQHFFAIDLTAVERVIQAVAMIPLPHPPKNVCGAIDVHGEVVPVVALRKVLGLPERGMELTDQLIICTLGGMKVALWVDAVEAVADYQSGEFIAPEGTASARNHVRSVIKQKNKSILICDWESLCVAEHASC